MVSSKSKTENKIGKVRLRGNLDFSIKQDLWQVYRLWNFIVDNELCCISVYLYDLFLLFVYVVKQQFASWKYESKSNVSLKMRYKTTNFWKSCVFEMPVQTPETEKLLLYIFAYQRLENVLAAAK